MLRVLASLTLLLGLGVAVATLVRALPSTLGGAALATLLGVAVTPVLGSVLEWLVHRGVYHRSLGPLRAIYRVHHAGHHRVFFPTWRYAAAGPVRRFALGPARPVVHAGRLASALTGAGHMSAYATIGLLGLVLPAWLATRDLAFVAGIGAASAVVSWLFVGVHDAIHHPGLHPWFEGRAWFAWLHRHHFIHHVDTEANVNFLLPLADLLFGTLRRDLTPAELAEHASWEDARRPVGEDAPADRYVQRPRRAKAAASPAPLDRSPATSPA